MPRLKCDTHIEKPSVDIVDRIFDLRNRVKWLKNVEYCLLGDQTDRLAKIQVERHDLETENKNLREKMMDHDRYKDEKECIDYHRNRVIQEHNQLVFIKRSLSNRLQSLRNEKNIATPIKTVQKSGIIARRIREIQDRLASVKLMNKTLKTCKHYLQCDLDLLGKELPNIKKDIEQKFDQKRILQKELMNITTENKRHLKEYQQLLNQTEIQSQQRREIHEQAMASVTEQLEDQYQVQMTGNDMATSFESRKFNVGTNSTTNLQRKNLPTMNNDEIIQVRCMHEQFYNMIMSGFPFDLTVTIDFHQGNLSPNEISSKITALLTMTNRMMEEKEQISEQINRTDKLLKLIEMSLDRKNDTRQKLMDTMIEQRQKLEILYKNDMVDEQNRILRQINDFTIVISNILCRYVDKQSLNEPSIDLIERLQYLFELIKTTIETKSTDEDINSSH